MEIMNQFTSYIPSGVSMFMALFGIATVVIAINVFANKFFGGNKNMTFTGTMKKFIGFPFILAQKLFNLIYVLPIVHRSYYIAGKLLPDSAIKAFWDAAFVFKKGLARGTWEDRAREAMRRFPQSEFPTVWMKDSQIPDDLKRSFVADGHLLNGEPLSNYATMFLKWEHLIRATRFGLMAGATWLVLMAIIYHPNVYFNGTSEADLTTAESVIYQQLKETPSYNDTIGKDYWSDAEHSKAVQANDKKLHEIAAEKAKDGSSSGSYGFLTMIATAFLIGFGVFRRYIFQTLNSIPNMFTAETKEQTQTQAQ